MKRSYALQMKILRVYEGDSAFFVQDTYLGTFGVDVFTKPYEPEQLKLILSSLKCIKNPIFIDVGAAVGAHSLRVAAYGFEVKAIEPNINNIKALTENLKLNNFVEDFEILQAIAKPQNDNSINITDKERWELSRGDKYVDTSIDFWNLANELNKKGITSIIKVDIEGAEWPFFGFSFINRFKKTRNVVILSVHIGFNREFRKKFLIGKLIYRAKVITELLKLLYMSFTFRYFYELKENKLTKVNFCRRRLFWADGWKNPILISNNDEIKKLLNL